MSKTFIIRVVTQEQKQAIDDYLAGKRFMSKYHGGQKKEKVKKERKGKKEYAIGDMMP